MHDIHVLCYPSHTTHVFQGLDVICFGLLKRIFNDERRKFEQQGYRTLKKEHFLQVYAAAHVHALTADVVKAAFAKTGVVPYNPEAIKTAVFKPSIESSTVGTGTPVSEPVILLEVKLIIPSNYYRGFIYNFTVCTCLFVRHSPFSQ